MGNSKAVEYSLARREYEANRALYDGLQQRLQEAGIIAGLHSTNIRRIDPADAPDFPSSPRMSVNLTLGLLCGLGIGLLLSFMVEALDTNIKTIYDIEERLGLPMLGVVPQVDSKLLLQKFLSGTRPHRFPAPGRGWPKLTGRCEPRSFSPGQARRRRSSLSAAPNRPRARHRSPPWSRSCLRSMAHACS
jgi:hypothetical protein